MVDTRRGTGDLAVVGVGVEVEDCEALFEEVNAGDEGLALDAVLVKIVGMAI